MLCFVVVLQSFIMNPHEIFIHIHQGCFAGTGAIVRLPQCQWSKPDGYGKISQCITTTNTAKQNPCAYFLGYTVCVDNLKAALTKNHAHDSRFAVFCGRLYPYFSWWRHQMETFSALLDFCVGNSPVTGEFLSQRPVARSFDIFFDLRTVE